MDGNFHGWEFPPFLAVSITFYVAGSKLEATDGQTFTIPFKIDELERADQVTIILERENEKTHFLARYCSQTYVNPSCVPVETDGVSLQVEGGNVFLILQNVSISRNSGLYTAQAIFEEKVSEVNVMLVVNKASFSSTEVPAHSSPTKPPSSSQLQWLYALIPLAIFIPVCVLFWQYRKTSKNVSRQTMLSPDPVSPKEGISASEYVAITMNDCGENPLPSSSHTLEHLSIKSNHQSRSNFGAYPIMFSKRKL